jgi:hypothetical protein
LIFTRGDVISYIDMCKEEAASLQRGMNFHLRGRVSVILMSIRRGAPCADRVENDGSVLIYEGHDVARSAGSPDPKTVDQPLHDPSGRPTQNALFLRAATEYKSGRSEADIVKVYEKIRPGIWVYNGLFRLTDAWRERNRGRKVFRFKLELADTASLAHERNGELHHERLIPASVKQEVWMRDRGRCVICGAKTNLHFDHIIPYSKGGSSLTAENIQLLCAKHNIEKRDKIQ